MAASGGLAQKALTPTTASPKPRRKRASVIAGLKLTILPGLSGISTSSPRISLNALTNELALRDEENLPELLPGFQDSVSLPR